MLSLIYSEILKMLRLWDVPTFDVEIFFPRDSHSFPRGYQNMKSKESDQSHIMTSQALLVEVSFIDYLRINGVLRFLYGFCLSSWILSQLLVVFASLKRYSFRGFGLVIQAISFCFFGAYAKLSS